MLKKYIPKSEFGLNFLTLLTGSGLSQLILVGVSPILTRIYSPEDFGIFALFISVSSILLVFGTGRYELAIIQTKEDVDGLSLAIGTLGISFCFFVFSELIIFIFSNYSRLNELDLKLAGLLYLIPIYVLIVSFYKILSNYLIRNKLFKIISINQVGQSFYQSIGKIFLGYKAIFMNGLIIGTVFGQALALLTLCFYFIKIKTKKEVYKAAVKKIKLNCKLFIDFPKFMLMSDGINIVASQLPFLLTSYLFSIEQLGFLAFAYSMSSRPLSFIADSLSRVFRQQAAFEYNENGRCDRLFLTIFKKLSIYLLLPFIFILFTAPYLFQIVFGEEWFESGIMVRAIIIMFYFQFLARILGYMYILSERQKENLYLQIVLLIGALISFGTGYFVFKDLYISLILFSFMYSLIYIFMIYKSYVFSKGE